MNNGKEQEKEKSPLGTDSELQPENIHEKKEEEEAVFKWHYPLLIPYSRAAIVEDKKGDTKYLLLEPTLSAEDKLWIKQVKDILWDEISVGSTNFETKEEAEFFLKSKIEEMIKKYKITVDPYTLEKYEYYIIRDFLNFAKIDGLMRDEFIEDISCDGVGYPLYVWHRKYESIPTNLIFDEKEELDSFIVKLAYLCGRTISISQPLLDGTLPDGSRAQLTYGSEVTPKGSTFTIRKFKSRPLTITDLIDFNTLSPEMAAYFWFLIENRHSVMIGGDIGGGKTTMLNAFSLFIRPNLKIVSIEDTQEIRLPHENWQMMVTRQGLDTGAGAIGEQGRGAISMFNLLRAAFRQRPDYIIVGEIRGEEAYALFQAMSTGHLGLTTIHAENVKGVLHRLTTKPMDIPLTLVENLDAIAIVRRMVINNVSIRRTIEVAEMIGGGDNKDEGFRFHPIWKWDPYKDTYNEVGKSHLLKEIANQWGYSTKEINQELRKRKVILNYLARKHIHSYERVSQILMEYFSDPEIIYRKAKVS